MATSRKRKVWRWIVGGVLLAGAVSAIFAVRASMKPNTTIDSSKLKTVERDTLAKSVVATGKIEPLTKVEVKSKASGIVKKLFADYGERVKQGQILVELDKVELAARLREAEASLQAAQAAMQSAEAVHERNKVEAEAPDLPFLKASMERARTLHGDGLVSKSVLEEAERQYQAMLNKQQGALRNLAVSRADVERAKAQVAQAQAGLERTQEDLRNSTIVSPMDGVVLSRNVEVGDAVSSILVLGSQATLVMTLGDTSSVYVKGKVDESDIGKVYLGQTARITIESFKDKKFNGQVTKISPLGVEKDNVTTFEVRASIQNPGGELKANMSANAEIILEERKNVLVVPESALIYDKDRSASVETPDPQSPAGRKKVPVKIGISNGVKAEILEGIGESQQVILQ
jgi:HlyD family secretion protein